MSTMTVRNFIFYLTQNFLMKNTPYHSLAFVPIMRSRSTINISTILTSLFSSENSITQAENCIHEYFPQFYYLLRHHPAALQRMRDSSTGFAVFAPSDMAIGTLGLEMLDSLEYACNDPDLSPIVEMITAFHIVSVPMTVEIMSKYNVVPTSAGELPVHVSQHGSLLVNGVNILQSYQFEDRIIRNYQDRDGNFLGSEMETNGKVCIIHEVDGFVCPDELWTTLFNYYQAKIIDAKTQ